MDHRRNNDGDGVAQARALPGKPLETGGVRALLLQAVTRHVVRHAHQLAQEIGARAVVLCADAIERDEELRQIIDAVGFPAILVTRARAGLPPLGW